MARLGYLGRDYLLSTCSYKCNYRTSHCCTRNLRSTIPQLWYDTRNNPYSPCTRNPRGIVPRSATASLSSRTGGEARAFGAPSTFLPLVTVHFRDSVGSPKPRTKRKGNLNTPSFSPMATSGFPPQKNDQPEDEPHPTIFIAEQKSSPASRGSGDRRKTRAGCPGGNWES